MGGRAGGRPNSTLTNRRVAFSDVSTFPTSTAVHFIDVGGGGPTTRKSAVDYKRRAPAKSCESGTPSSRKHASWIVIVNHLICKCSQGVLASQGTIQNQRKGLEMASAVAAVATSAFTIRNQHTEGASVASSPSQRYVAFKNSQLVHSHQYELQGAKLPLRTVSASRCGVVCKVVRRTCAKYRRLCCDTHVHLGAGSLRGRRGPFQLVDLAEHQHNEFLMKI